MSSVNNNAVTDAVPINTRNKYGPEAFLYLVMNIKTVMKVNKPKAQINIC